MRGLFLQHGLEHLQIAPKTKLNASDALLSA